VRVMSLDIPDDMCEVGTMYFRRNNRKIGYMALSTAMVKWDKGNLTLAPDYKPVKKKKDDQPAT